MLRKVVTFQRAQLFDEVWTEPLGSLAKRYGVDMTAVRAAAVAMDVPRPPSKHWSQVEYGKARPKPELPESSAPVTDQHGWDEPEDGVFPLPRRVRTAPTLTRPQPEAPAVAAPSVRPPPSPKPAGSVEAVQAPKAQARTATAAEMPTDVPAEVPAEVTAHALLPPLATSLDQCLPLVRTMAARLKKAYLDQRKFPAIGGPGIFEMAVSPGNQLRALLTLDRALRHCKSTGLKLVANDTSKKPAFFALEGQELSIQVFESAKQIPNELTDAERAKLKKDPHAYLYRDKYAFVPSNILKLEVREASHNWNRFTVAETANRPLAERLENFPELLKAEATRLRLQDEKREESSRQYPAAEAKRAEQRTHRKAELEKLERFENMATRLVRAQRLRELATILGTARSLDGADPAAKLQWLAEAADWLDPTVKRFWPGVDGVA